MKEQLKIQWFKFFSAVKVKQKLDVSYMIHWAKFQLKTKISPVNHIFNDKYFPKESTNATIYTTNKS